MPAAYQDENGKWWKECSSTKQLFGGVDTKEELGEWFSKSKIDKDGYRVNSKEYEKQYREQNKQKRKQYRQQNKEKISQRQKEYSSRPEIKKRINELTKKYNKTPKGLYNHYNVKAKKREINFTLTREWFEEQMTKPEFNTCYYSGVEFVNESNHPYSRSLDRISSTKGYTADNVRWVCRKLNSWKSDLTLDEIAIMFNAMAKHHNINPFEVLKKVVDTQSIRG